MRALTLHRPWDEPVVGRPPDQNPIDAAKPVENRGWPVPRKHLGATIAIHAGKHYSEDGRRFCKRVGFELLRVGDSERWRAGRVVGTVRVVGCIQAREHSDPDIAASPKIMFGLGGVHVDFDAVWFFGPYGWLFDSAVALPRPVECRGRQGLWTLPATVDAEVRRQLQEVSNAEGD